MKNGHPDWWVSGGRVTEERQTLVTQICEHRRAGGGGSGAMHWCIILIPSNSHAEHSRLTQFVTHMNDTANILFN